MNWFLYGLALAVVLAGFVSGINLLRTIRSFNYLQAEIVWQQPAISYWKYETTSMIAISINDVGLICLAILLLVSSADSDVFMYFTKSVISFLLSLLCLFGILIVTHNIGSSLGFHFARGWIQPVSFGINNDGLLYGGAHVTWKSLSHYELGPDHGLISLYSSYSPSLRTWVLNPPTEVFAGVLDIVQKNLPSSPVDSLTSWQHSPLMLILRITALSLVASLPAVWGLLHDETWTWVYTLAACLSVQLLSAKIMTTFDGRGKYPAAPARTQ